MEGFLSGCFMSFVFLVFLILRRKKYEIPFKWMLLIHIIFTVTGAFGASLGAYLSGLTWVGKRLHMLVLVDALTVVLFSALFKKDEHHLADYLSIPVIAVCAAAKVGCVIIGCCYGVVLAVNEQGAEVRFPSAAVELAVWILLDIWLYARERKGNIKGFLYPVAMIGAGFARFAVDFLRGSFKERQLKILGVPVGAFWSLVLLLMGIVYLNRLFKKCKNRRPTIKELLKIAIGV